MRIHDIDGGERTLLKERRRTGGLPPRTMWSGVTGTETTGTRIPVPIVHRADINRHLR